MYTVGYNFNAYSEGWAAGKHDTLIEKDRNGKEHIVVVDTPEHAKFYKTGGEMRLATMYVKEN